MGSTWMTGTFDGAVQHIHLFLYIVGRQIPNHVTIRGAVFEDPIFSLRYMNRDHITPFHIQISLIFSEVQELDPPSMIL